MALRRTSVLSGQCTIAGRVHPIVSEHHEAEADLSGPTSKPWASRLLDALMVLAAILAAIAYGLAAMVASASSQGHDHTDGVWTGIAQFAAGETLYPPLATEHLLGGTRYMPLPIAAHAWLGQALGDFDSAGHGLALAGLIAAFGALVALLRRLAVDWPIALGLAALPLASVPGYLVGLSIRYDAWPIAFQFLGILLVLSRHPTDRRLIVLAGACCGIAFLTKLTALWAPAAIVLWLVLQRRRGLLAFTGAAIVVVSAGLAAAEIASGGRMSDNLLSVTLSGTPASSFGWVTPFRFAHKARYTAPLAWILLPAAAATAIALRRDAHMRLLALCLLLNTATTIIIFSDIGVRANHFLGMLMLSAAVLARGAARLGERPGSTPMLLTGACCSLWFTATGLISVFHPNAERLLAPRPGSAATLARQGDGDEALSTLVPSEARVLTEDPSLAYRLGRRPEILDSFMARRIAARRPDLIEPLVARIERREYDLIILLNTIEPDSPLYTTYHLGPTISGAIIEHYRFDRLSDGWAVYTPRNPPATPSPDQPAPSDSGPN